MKESQLHALLAPVVARNDLELEAVEILPAGKRRLVRIVVDGDGLNGSGPTLDAIAQVTKAISAALDDTDVTGANPYTLEVSSRGVARPLVLPRHWRRNRGRLVVVTLRTGESVSGRIMSCSEEAAVVSLDGAERELAYADIAKALVQVELNRKLDESEEG
jgi:ribosome maturation factor RimP